MTIDDIKGNLEDLIAWAEKELQSTVKDSSKADNIEGRLSAYKEVMEILDGKV